MPDELSNSLYHNSAGTPMAGLGTTFVQFGQQYGVDPRVVAALAGAESSFGKFQTTACNPFGYFWKGYGKCSPFESITSAIKSVTHNIERRHIDAGQTNTTQLYTEGPSAYCHGDCSVGLGHLNEFLTDMGGSQNNLLYPCDKTGTKWIIGN